MRPARRVQVPSVPVEHFILAGVLCFAGSYAVASLWLPFGWDHGIMASVGDAMLRGGLPYKDGWDMKGPLAYVIFAVSEGLFGQVMWGIRVVELAILAPVLYLIFRIIAAHTDPLLGAWTSIAFYLWLASAGWFFTAQPEIWVTAASVIAIFPLLRPGASSIGRTIFLSGVFIGCAGLIKPFYLAYGLVPLAVASAFSRWSIWQALRNALWLAAGAMAPILLVLGYLAAFGGLSEAINVHLRYASSIYSSSLDLRSFFIAVTEFPAQATIAVSLPFVAIGLWSLRGHPLFLPLVTWLGVTLFFVIVQTKAFTYHWYPFYVPYIILAAFGLDALWKYAPESWVTRILGLGAAVVFFAQIAAIPARELFRVSGYMAGLYSSETHYDRYKFRSYTAGDQIRAAKHIEAHSAPTDRVFVWGVDSTASFLSRRSNPTRFAFNMPLTMESPFKEGYRAEMMQALYQNPPKYIIVGLPWEMDDNKKSFLEFSQFNSFVKQGYVLETSFGILDLYRHKAAISR